MQGFEPVWLTFLIWFSFISVLHSQSLSSSLMTPAFRICLLLPLFSGSSLTPQLHFPSTCSANLPLKQTSSSNLPQFPTFLQYLVYGFIMADKCLLVIIFVSYTITAFPTACDLSKHSPSLFSRVSAALHGA